MENLIDFLKRYNHWFIFLLLEVISMVMLFRFNHYQGSVWFTQANSVAATFNGIYSDIEEFFHLRTVNEDLTEQNTMLQLQNDKLREELKEANAKPSSNDSINNSVLKNYKVFRAKVVSSSIVKDNNYLVINVGSADGISENMGVVGGGGIVGIVHATSSHYSLVVPLINDKAQISCRVRESGESGTLVWSGTGLNKFNLNGIPRYAKVEKGAIIETSGLSDIFPPGLFVGKVTGSSNAPDGVTTQLKVNIGTNFSNLRNVTVFQNLHKPEIDDLKNKAEDLDLTASERLEQEKAAEAAKEDKK